MDVFFTRDHEWIRIDGGIGTVGITAYAVEQLGDVTFVELPKKGKELGKSDVLCAVESVKAASDVYAPLSGRVAEVNATLETMPEILNRSPEEEGWMVRLELTEPVETGGLMTRDQYDEYVKGLA
ncbi:MAG: glycine cleavage system protein GcvH [Geobacteraceae bacterium]|nr:glycine cleavage system protein GcvH [Geobacteraceae bacterium]